MPTTAEKARCRLCDAVLSRYRAADEPQGLCASCARQKAAERDECLLHPEALVYAVAGVLSLSRALGRGRVHLQRELAAQGIVADAVDVNKAVEKLRRRYGMVVSATAREPGYELVAWPFRFRRRRWRQLALFRPQLGVGFAHDGRKR